MRARAKRAWLIAGAGTILVIAMSLTFVALQSAVSLFYTPGQLQEIGGGTTGDRARIGGLVRVGSLAENDEGVISFVVEDTIAEIAVSYDGFVPDLFREGQGVVATGTFTGPYAFEADELLAKHDENYLPREVEEALEEQGVLRHNEAGY